MRLILSMVLVASATALVCHGYFYREEADKAYDAARSVRDYEKVMEAYPYSLAAVRAGEARIESLVKSDPDPTGKDFFPVAYGKIERGVDLDTAPWIMPTTAGAAALIGLLLAILMPGTRFRGMTILLFLAGAAALMPSYMEDGRQVDLVDGFESTQTAIAWHPFIATGLMLIAAFSLGSRRRLD